MEKNIGKADKVIRLVLAVVFLYLGWRYSPWLYIVTAVLIVTVMLGFCLPYKLLGISTIKKKV